MDSSRLLVVDDDVKFSRLLREYLSRWDTRWTRFITGSRD
jgi:hypothetical protein